MTSNSIEELKSKAEIRKLEAETQEKIAQAEALKRGNNWWVKYSPLLLALLALFGGWTQYTRLSMEDRENSVDAKLSVLAAQENLEIAQHDQQKAEAALTQAQQELSQAQKELSEKQKILQATVAEIKDREDNLQALKLEIVSQNQKLLKLASEAGADSQAVENIKLSTEETLKKFSDFEINEQILIEKGFQRF